MWGAHECYNRMRCAHGYVSAVVGVAWGPGKGVHRVGGLGLGLGGDREDPVLCPLCSDLRPQETPGFVVEAREMGQHLLHGRRVCGSGQGVAGRCRGQCFPGSRSARGCPGLPGNAVTGCQDGVRHLDAPGLRTGRGSVHPSPRTLVPHSQGPAQQRGHMTHNFSDSLLSRQFSKKTLRNDVSSHSLSCEALSELVTGV